MSTTREDFASVEAAPRAGNRPPGLDETRDAPALSPTPRQGAKRARAWLVAAAIAAVGVVLALVITSSGGAGSGVALAADSAAPTGGKALVSVLRDHGVDVRTAGTLKAATGAASGTALMYDPDGILDTKQLHRLARAFDHIVLIRPGFTALNALADGVRPAGAHATGVVPAHCDLDAAARAAHVDSWQASYRVDATATGCFPTGSGTFGLVERDGASTTSGPSATITVVGSAIAFDNDHITRSGNAALALNLLGATSRLVWYLPTTADLVSTAPPTLAELTPGWVTPVLLLAIAVTIAAAVWRGRRFGPLVVESLPVVVRAEETMEGRARLYERVSARGRAVDALRIGTIGRLATALGLPRSAELGAIVTAAASVSGIPPERVHALLVGDMARNDAELMTMAEALERLEATVHEATIDRQHL